MGIKSKYTGFFTPRNPQKYLGNPTNIMYRSSYELKYMLFLDSHEDVLKWGSEEMIIPYRAPDGLIRRYYPDFVVQFRDKTGKINNWMVEIKPHVQTQPPKVPKKMTKAFLEEVETFEVNKAKWAAAQAYCQKVGLEFKVLTEAELGINNAERAARNKSKIWR